MNIENKSPRNGRQSLDEFVSSSIGFVTSVTMFSNRTRMFPFTIFVLLALNLEALAQTTHPRRAELTARQIAQRTLPSVVVLIAERDGSDTVSIGTGFFVDKDVIATNYHVVKDASQISAHLIVQKATFRISGIIGVDRDKDLALLRVEGIKIRPLLLGNIATLRIGDEIFVVGNPEGWEGTFSQGIVSGFRGTRYVQITAPMSHDSSGGPVLNKRGEVVGVAVAATAEGQNLNFAISSSALAAFKKSTLSDNLSQYVFPAIPFPRDVPPVRPGRILSPSKGLISKGNDYYQRKLYAKAAEEYQAAIRENSQDAEAYYRLGTAYIELSKNGDAIDAYTTALKLGNVYDNIPNDKESIKAYSEVVGPGRGNDLARFLSGEANLKRCWNQTALQKYTVFKLLKSNYADHLRKDIELHKCEYDFTGIDLDELPPD